MTSITYKNETIKRRFFNFLKTKKGFCDNSIQRYENSILIWQKFANKSDFNNFNGTIAEEFRDWLKVKIKNGTDKKISLSYCYDNLRHMQNFFEWLFDQPGYKSKTKKMATQFLNLTKKEIKEATQPRTVKYPSLEEIKITIENIKGETEIEMRDKAIFSLAYLTGARVSALRTLPMKSFDKTKLTIYQDPQMGVQTKFSNKIATYLIPFEYKEPIDYFLRWFNYLQEFKKFSPDDPIFPTTKIEKNEKNVNFCSSEEIDNKFFKTSTSIRKIMAKRFEQARIQYYHPHTFRHFFIKEMAKLPLTEEEKKAISQNLGHEDVATTFGSYGYGKMDENKQIELMKNIDFEGRKKEVKMYLSLDEVKELLKEKNNLP